MVASRRRPALGRSPCGRRRRQQTTLPERQSCARGHLECLRNRNTVADKSYIVN